MNTKRSLSDQVLMTFPSGNYCLPALLRVLEIVESTHVPTACVECVQRPRMFINPEFVSEHATTAEKLLMLVLHELHHVILGHTRLYPRPTPLDNLVFDAVINAMLCQLFPEPEYTALFTEFYPDNKFPECFLRPAKDWRPGSKPVPRLLERRPYRQFAPLHQALYSESGVTYSELRDALAKNSKSNDFDIGVLLGDHRDKDNGASSAGDLESRAPVLLEELRRIVERWPRRPNPITGRSMHDMLESDRVMVARPSNRTTLAKLMRKIGNSRVGNRFPRIVPSQIAVQSPIPRFDRRSLAVSALA